MTTAANRRSLGAFTPFGLAFLVVVLLTGTTGGAVAGALITGKQIKDGTVTTADIAKNTVNSNDVRKDSLNSTDIADEARYWGDALTESYPFNVSTSPAATGFASRAGFLQITATIDAADNVEGTGVDDLLFTIFIDGKQINVVHALDFAGEGAGANGMITAVVRVAQGSHLVELVVAQASDPDVDGESGFIMYGAELSVGYAGVGSSGVEVLSERPAHGRIIR